MSQSSLMTYFPGADSKQEVLQFVETLPDVKMYFIRLEDLYINPVVQLKCQNCGMYGRTLKCPPHAPYYHKVRNRLLKYNFFRLLISEVDETPWFKRQKEKFKASDWKAHFYAGNTAFQIAKKKLNDAVYKFRDFLQGYGHEVQAFGAGGGCSRCRPCGIENMREGKVAVCKKPKESIPSPEAWGIDLYTTLRRLGIPIDIPPVETYRCVGLIAAKVPWEEEIAPRNYKNPYPTEPMLDLPWKFASELFDNEITCEDCEKYSDFLCDPKYFPWDNDILRFVSNEKRLFFAALDYKEPKKTILQLHRHTLDLHRAGYWWALPLLETRCPMCDGCSLEIHRYEKKYELVPNRQMPRCVKYFKLDPARASFKLEKPYGYILV